MGAIKRNIPNFLTCLNLLSGCVGLVFVLGNYPLAAVYMMFIAMVFDFLDGLVARLLKVTSPIGKDLDSLADIVTFGVLPGIMMYKLLYTSLFHSDYVMHNPPFVRTEQDNPILYVSYIALLIPVFSAIRLARFNNDPSQSYDFKGLATPANGLLLASIFYLVRMKSRLFQPNPALSIQSRYEIWEQPGSLFEEKYVAFFSHPWVIIGLILVCCFLLVSPLKLMAFKFKGFGWKQNGWKYILLIGCAPIIISFGFASAPIIIILYIIISQIHFRTTTRTAEGGESMSTEEIKKSSE